MKTIQNLIVLLLLTGLCVAQPAPSDGDAVAKKSPSHHVAKKAVKKAEPAASAEDIKQLKELIQAQQAQIDQLKHQATQHDEQTVQAQQAATEAQKSAAAAQEKAAATETVVANTNSKVETVQSDVSDLKTTATNAAVTTQEEQKRVSTLEAINNRLRFSGDVRLRYENFFQRAAGVQDRERFRIRLRFGVDGKLSDDFVGGFALATGAQADPTSTNQTLGDSGNSPNFERKTINLDRAYVTWNPQAYKWFSATGGKFAYTWVRTNPSFDPDINPEGFSEKVAFKLANPIVKEVSVTGMELVLQTNDSKTLPNTDSWAYGAQIGTKLRLGSRWSMVPTYALLNFVRPNAAIFGASGTATPFAPNNLDNCTTTVKYANVTAPARGFCSQFLYSDLIVSNVIQTGVKSLPFAFIGEYEKNLNANPSAKNAAFNPNGDGKIHDTMYYLEASLGQTKNQGDIQFGYAYTHTEQDAVISSFAESDSFHQTNNEQNRVFFNWKVRNNTILGYTQWIGRFLDPALSGKTVSTNPYLKRGQLDVVYTF
jgi:hypothetical protein